MQARTLLGMSIDVRHEQSSIAGTVIPAEQHEVSALVRDAYARDLPVFIGGNTGANGLFPARVPSIHLVTTGLNRVVDYPARDMTITIEAGITMSALAEALATERQWLPIDVPQPERATLGAVIDSNISGERRYGCGTMRDYVIGISAVDGRGTPFKGGGRVVKNVAGYDFCKLLTGSMGTLGVITQVTLKVRPIPEASALLQLPVADLGVAEKLLASMSKTRTTPIAIELLSGPAWCSTPRSSAPCQLVAGLEGTSAEVDWMLAKLQTEWAELGGSGATTLQGDTARHLWRRLADFAAPDARSLIIKVGVLPSAVTQFVQAANAAFPSCSIQAHAGNGILAVRLDQLQESQTTAVIQQVRRLAEKFNGHAGVLSTPTSAAGDRLTRELMLGPAGPTQPVMDAIKQQLDPKGLLNPGRFIFA